MKIIQCVTVAAVFAFWLPASHSAGFNCAKASGYVEQTICATPSLSSLDDRISVMFRQALLNHPDEAAAIKKAQVSWLKEVRNRATSVEGIQRAYLDRIDELDHLLPQASAQPVSPPPAPNRQDPAAQPQPSDMSPPAAQAHPSGMPEAPTPSGQPQPAATTTSVPSTTSQYCQVIVNVSSEARESYISGHKTKPGRLQVSDSADAFTVHFAGYYGLGEMNSGPLSPSGSASASSRQENSGAATLYTRQQTSSGVSYAITLLTPGSEKARFDARLYDCKLRP